MEYQILTNEQFFLDKKAYIDAIISGAKMLAAYMEQHPGGLKNSYPFDLIVILGASMQKDKRGRWTLPTIVENDPGKVVGGWYRAKAAIEAYRRCLTGQFIVTGGLQTDLTGSFHSRAEILSKKVVTEGNISKDKVIPLTSVTSDTRGNVQSIIQYLENHFDVLKTRRLGIITSYYHMPRAIQMFKENQFFAEQSIELVPVPAEWLLLIQFRRAAEIWIRKLYSKPEMEIRQLLEAQGVKALTNLTYKS